MKRFSKIFGLLLVAQVCCVTMLFGANGFKAQNPNFDDVSKSFAQRVLDEYAKCDYNLAIYAKAFNEWLEFAERSNETPNQADIAACIQRFESYAAQFKSPTEITLSQSDVMALRKQGLNASELLAHNLEYKAYYDQMCYNIYVLIHKVQQPSIKMLVESSILGYEADMLSLEITYYSMLHTFSQLSDAIYNKDLTNRLATLNYQFSVDIQLPMSEYQRMADTTVNKLARISSQIAEMSNSLGNNVMQAEELYARVDNACEALDAATELLFGLDAMLLTAEDTKESAHAKIVQSMAIVDNFKVCATEYIDLLTALCEILNSDTAGVEDERAFIEAVVLEYSTGIDNMKRTYELLGFGKFE